MLSSMDANAPGEIGEETGLLPSDFAIIAPSTATTERQAIIHLCAVRHAEVIGGQKRHMYLLSRTPRQIGIGSK